MPTQLDPVKLIYLVAYDGQTPRVGVEYSSPLDSSTQQQTVELTDTDILADLEALQAKIAATKGLERPNAPVQEAPTNG